MFNQNSPIIQQMLSGINAQQTIGNFSPEFYRGASPTVYQPDPMQMVQQRQQQQSYGMNSVNPLMINGYNNPYFTPSGQVPNFSVAVNSYTPNFNNYGRTVYPYDPTMDPFYGFDPYDQNSRSIMQNALYSGLTYMEQANIESELMQKAMGLFLRDSKEYTQEQKDQIQNYFAVKEKKKVNTLFNPTPYNSKSVSDIDCSAVEVVINRGSDVVYRTKDHGKQVDEYTLAKCEMDVQYEPIIQTNFRNHVEYLKQRDAYLYSTALEREADGMDMYDFMEKVGPKIVRQMKEEDARKQKYLMLTDVYSSDSFRKILEKNTGKKINKPNEIRGRNGILPNGRMVSQGVDPRIAESFVRDPATGRITLTVPDFIKNRIDDSPFREGILQREMDNRKAAFMRSLHDNTIREEIFNRGG